MNIQMTSYRWSRERRPAGNRCPCVLLFGRTFLLRLTTLATEQTKKREKNTFLLKGREREERKGRANLQWSRHERASRFVPSGGKGGAPDLLDEVDA